MARKTIAIAEDLHKEMLETVYKATGVYPQIQEFVEDAIKAKLQTFERLAKLNAKSNLRKTGTEN